MTETAVSVATVDNKLEILCTEKLVTHDVFMSKVTTVAGIAIELTNGVV